jgi:hypothetical protein
LTRNPVTRAWRFSVVVVGSGAVTAVVPAGELALSIVIIVAVTRLW